jgi:hypothetical protein
MIQNPKRLAEFEKELLRKTKPNYQKNLALFEAMHLEYLKVLGKRKSDLLEGIEVKIKIARAINSV